MCCRVLRWVAVRCSAVQCVTVRCSASQCVNVLQRVAACCSVMQYIPLHVDQPLEQNNNLLHYFMSSKTRSFSESLDTRTQPKQPTQKFPQFVYNLIWEMYHNRAKIHWRISREIFPQKIQIHFFLSKIYLAIGRKCETTLPVSSLFLFSNGMLAIAQSLSSLQTKFNQGQKSCVHQHVYHRLDGSHSLRTRLPCGIFLSCYIFTYSCLPVQHCIMTCTHACTHMHTCKYI